MATAKPLDTPMIEWRPGATEPATVVMLPGSGGPPRRADAALTRQQRRLVDRVNWEDSEWFRRHPDQLERIRPLVRGELAPLVEDSTWRYVVVVRIGHQRARLPLAALPEGAMLS